jgi:hypothetical protein
MKFSKSLTITQEPESPESGRMGRWDYFIHPDRFFFWLFKGHLPLRIPIVILLLTIIFPLIVIRVLTEYISPFVPYYNFSGSGIELVWIGSVLLLWATGIFYFLFFSGSFIETITTFRSLKKKTIRLFAAIAFALIPFIVVGILISASFLIILAGIQIDPSSTDAYTAYRNEEADYYRALDQHWDWDSAPARGVIPSARPMVVARDSAEREAGDGMNHVVVQLKQDPTLRTLSSLAPIVAVITMFWAGILLIFGIRRALNISLARSLCLVGILAYLNILVMQYSSSLG